jgi:pimeloyl-ACP methyl ester carboxylesterase
MWAADARFTAAQLPSWDGAHTDTAHVAYVGHSLGGAASLQACHDDPACVGAADLDGTPYGPVAVTGLAAPFLLLSSQDGCLAGMCTPGTGTDGKLIEAAITDGIATIADILGTH